MVVEYGAKAIGSKAFNLCKIQSGGIRVPIFFVISNDEFQKDAKIIQQKITHMLSKMSAEYFAVRSSSNLEDGKNASFAGLFKTILNVPKEEVSEAVFQVFASANSHQLHEYCASKNISVEKVTINVIVQEQINSVISGICITRLDFFSDYLYVEACQGQCAAIADGKIVPSSYQINRSNRKIIAAECGDQSIILTCNRSGGLQEIKNNTNVLELPVLSESQLLKIVNTALKIEQFLDMEAVDIEWTFDRQNLYILQARPYVRI